MPADASKAEKMANDRMAGMAWNAIGRKYGVTPQTVQANVNRHVVKEFLADRLPKVERPKPKPVPTRKLGVWLPVTVDGLETCTPGRAGALAASGEVAAVVIGLVVSVRDAANLADDLTEACPGLPCALVDPGHAMTAGVHAGEFDTVLSVADPGAWALWAESAVPKAKPSSARAKAS